jgi:polyhydroxyalkanoate synthase
MEAAMTQLALVRPQAAKPPGQSSPAASAAKAGTPEDSGYARLDRSFHAGIARFTSGLSPAAIAGAYLDWAFHLALSPGKQLELATEALSGDIDNMRSAAGCSCNGGPDPCTCALAKDSRFRAPEWRQSPFSAWAQSFLSVERWWDRATKGVRGVSKHHEDLVSFGARQLLDSVAPSNFVATNPVVLERTRREHGANLVRGVMNFIDDAGRIHNGKPLAGAERYRVGETVATTPGKVVHRTRIAEVIQYAPTTGKVRPEPVVILPAWIMKYYILDLSPENSLVKFLVDQGYTVFMVSWRNPGAEERDTTIEDYRTEGALAAIDAATAITGADKVHGVGYFIGGTLLAITAAAMAHDGDDRLKSMSLLAAQTDFSDAGELRLFIDDSQLAFLEDMMWQKGFHESKQMGGVFQLLRANDLIWSPIVHYYLMGERSDGIDIMAWNADGTRMPYRMHAQYLRSLYLDNELSEGRFKVAGRPVSVHDIHVPVFALGTEQDHVAPWRSVYKFHLHANTEVTFALTNGGHNAGVLSEPGHRNRRYRIATSRSGDRYEDPDSWLAAHQPSDGSWWTAWKDWLDQRSDAPVAPPPLGKASAGFRALADAPGTYVMTR